MNYWLLTTEFPPFYGGGIATYCLNTAEMLAGQGYSVTVITPGTDSTSSLKKEATGTYKVIRFDPRHSEFEKYIGYFGGLSYRFAEVAEQLIAEGNIPDIIESQDYQGIAYYLLQFKLLKQGPLSNVPVVITLHSPAFVYLDVNRTPLYKFPEYQACEMEKQALAAADLVISPTKYMHKAVEKSLPIASEKIEIIPNPFLIRHQTPAGFHYTKNKIIFYGKLSLQKGVISLLEYFKEIWKSSDLQLVLIGGTEIVYYPQLATMGDYVKNRYKQYIDDGRLIVKDKIPPADLKKEIIDAHVVVLPSIIDNLPYALLECMSLGKVVLASAQGGQSEVIRDGENGFLFDHDRKDDFSKKLFSILSLNSGQLQKISDNALASIASNYSFKQVLCKKQQTILELINSYRSPVHFPFLHQEPHANDYDMNDDPLLSIVIPYYNMGNFLIETLESIKLSKYPTKEIIIVNDGSDDQRSIDLLPQVEKDYGCIIIHTSNEGLAEARNTGATNAKGSYLAFLDPDDKVAPDYYTKAIGVLRNFNNVYGVGCFVKYFEKKSSYWITASPQPPYILAHNSVNSSSLVYKRNAFLMAGLNDKMVDYGVEDYESVINMISHGYNIVVLPEVLFHYRVRKNSMFRNINRNKLLYSYKYIAEKHADYFRKYSVDLIHILNANGPGFLFDSSGFERKVFSIPSFRSMIDRKISKNSAVYKWGKKIFLSLVKK